VHPHDDIGLWAQFRDGRDFAGRPALFLDRDGVVVEEVHFLRRPEDVRVSPGMAAAIGRANRAGVPVVVVTNQSGVARGHFGWEDYAAVAAEIETRLLDEAGAWLDAVLACGYHAEGAPGLREDRRAWRKPSPGMLFAARDRLGVDLGRSLIVGDRVSDLEAGLNAGLARGTLVLTGYGREHRPKLDAQRAAWLEAGFACTVAADPSMAVADAVRDLTA
jgi:D-glycero-D-manno-heptose 1,7-bisphosphate phosphatase